MSISSARYKLLILDIREIFDEMKASIKNGTATYESLCKSRDLMIEKHKIVKEKASIFYFSFFKNRKIKGIIKKADKLIEEMR